MNMFTSRKSFVRTFVFFICSVICFLAILYLLTDKSYASEHPNITSDPLSSLEQNDLDKMPVDNCNFMVSKNGINYEYEDEILRIADGDVVSIWNVNKEVATNHRIIIEENAQNVAVYLKGVYVETDLGPALEIGENAQVDLYIEGTNLLTSIKDGCAGIQKNEGSDSYSKPLNINGYDDSKSSCFLEVHGGDGAAGIGSSRNHNVSNISIHDHCCINAYGGKGGAGIGSGEGGTLSILIISNSAICAYGSDGGSGIGSGKDGEAHLIYISEGSKIHACGGINGAGIGGGSNSYVNDIVIKNAEIFAKGGNNAAGIGGGNCEDAKNDTDTKYNVKNIFIGSGFKTLINSKGGINGAGIGGGANGVVSCIVIGGGHINSEGGINGAGIGGGANGVVNSLIITDGVITAFSNYAAGIGSAKNGQVDNIDISGGTINAFSKQAGCGIGGPGVNNVVFSGGSINADLLDCNPKDRQGKDVHLLVVPNPNREEVHIGNLNTPIYNPCNHSALPAEDNSNLYTYQPVNETEAIYVYVGKLCYVYVYNNGNTVGQLTEVVNLISWSKDYQETSNIYNLNLLPDSKYKVTREINSNEYKNSYDVVFYKTDDIQNHNSEYLTNVYLHIKIEPGKILGKKNSDCIDYTSFNNCIQKGPVTPLGNYGEVLKGGDVYMEFEAPHLNFKALLDDKPDKEIDFGSYDLYGKNYFRIFRQNPNSSVYKIQLFYDYVDFSKPEILDESDAYLITEFDICDIFGTNNIQLKNIYSPTKCITAEPYSDNKCFIGTINNSGEVYFEFEDTVNL